MGTAAVAMLAVAALVWDRWRVEDALRAADERFRVAADAARMGTWEWTIATGRVTWSPSLEALHGLAPGTFPGTYEAFQADVHPDDRAAVERAVTEALESGEHRVEYRIIRPDGAVRWVRAAARCCPTSPGARSACSASAST
jgi:PAS domain S-box-containing protein